jgi:hypothetical protein
MIHLAALSLCCHHVRIKLTDGRELARLNLLGKLHMLMSSLVSDFIILYISFPIHSLNEPKETAPDYVRGGINSTVPP